MIHTKLKDRVCMSNASEATMNVNHYRWLHLIVAGLLYAAANVIDYFLTVYGISINAAQEANPIVQGYIDSFGARNGLLLCKSLMVFIIISGAVVANLACRKKGLKHRVEYILYAGAFLTFLGGGLWLTKL